MTPYWKDPEHEVRYHYNCNTAPGRVPGNRARRSKMAKVLTQEDVAKAVAKATAAEQKRCAAAAKEAHDEEGRTPAEKKAIKAAIAAIKAKQDAE